MKDSSAELNALLAGEIQRWEAIEGKAQRLAPASGHKAVEVYLYAPDASNLPIETPAPQASPRYTARAVQVSASTTSVSNGSLGLSFCQIQTASTSLVGFSRPGISFR